MLKNEIGMKVIDYFEDEEINVFFCFFFLFLFTNSMEWKGNFCSFTVADVTAGCFYYSVHCI